MSQNLTPGDGRVICDDCGEELLGFQEEEMDNIFAGTAVTNRMSQSSQAFRIRNNIAVMKDLDELPTTSDVDSTPNELVLCEAMFLYTRLVVDRLIELQYVSPRIKKPLFEITACWARRCHNRFHHFSVDAQRKLFRPFHSFSLICLAAVYIRSALLPRDICRLVYTRQIPYIGILKTIFPSKFSKSKKLRAALTPRSLPIPQELIQTANLMALDNDTWPPLRIYFLSNITAGTSLDVPKFSATTSAFPVGNLHVTLLRLTRLLGLPDEFGARVLRFAELRQIAVKMSRVLHNAKGGPWDESQLDGYDITFLKPYLNDTGKFADMVHPYTDMYGYPTHESVMIDLINSMRLCYGRRGTTSRLRWKSIDSNVQGYRLAEDRKLLAEWERCKDAMMAWLRRGNPEDLDAVGWTGLTPNVLASLRGKQLRRYTQLVDDMLDGAGEHAPEMWGEFLQEWKKIEEEGDEFDERDKNVEEWDDGEIRHVRTEKECMYDVGRCKDEVEFEPTQGKEEMEGRIGFDEPDVGEGRMAVIPVKYSNDVFATRGVDWLYAPRLTERYEKLRDRRDVKRRVRFDEDADGAVKKKLRGSGKKAMTVEYNTVGNRTEHEEKDAFDIDNEEEQQEEEEAEEEEGNEQEDDGKELGEEKQTERQREREESNRKKWGRENEPWYISQRIPSKKYEWTLLSEPAGIGLAWTIALRFFDGSNVELMGQRKVLRGLTNQGGMDELKLKCDSAMRVVLRYLRALRRSGPSECRREENGDQDGNLEADGDRDESDRVEERSEDCGLDYDWLGRDN